MIKLSELSFFTAFFVNFMILMLFSLTITCISILLPGKLFDYKQWLFKEKPFERGGRFYLDKCKIKRWKNSLPELSDFLKCVFPKKSILDYSDNYLVIYLNESCRAEITHEAIIASSFLFFIWNGLTMSLLIFIVAFILNIPFIIIQRYNRPRVIKILSQKKLKNKDILQYL